jgi:hypothetical protein
LRPPLPPPHASATTVCGAAASGRRCHLGACLHQRPAEGVGAWPAGRHGGVLVADVEASAPVAVVSRHLGDDALARLEQPRMQFGHAKCLLYAHGPRDLAYKRVPSRRHERRDRTAQGLGLLRRSRRLDLAVHLVIPYDASLAQHDGLFGERDRHMMWPSCGDQRLGAARRSRKGGVRRSWRSSAGSPTPGGAHRTPPSGRTPPAGCSRTLPRAP